MKCPVCHGSGWVQKRFLLFFTRRVRCQHCSDTGDHPRRASSRDRDTWSTRDDDRVIGFGSSRIDSGTSASRDDDRFAVGSGGRSGGAGGGASWDSAAGAVAPVIVDPFAEAGSPAEAEAASEDGASASDDSGSSADESGGTSY